MSLVGRSNAMSRRRGCGMLGHTILLGHYGHYRTDVCMLYSLYMADSAVLSTARFNSSPR
jgi:hypothetical protein